MSSRQIPHPMRMNTVEAIEDSVVCCMAVLVDELFEKGVDGNDEEEEEADEVEEEKVGITVVTEEEADRINGTVDANVFGDEDRHVITRDAANDGFGCVVAWPTELPPVVALVGKSETTLLVEKA